MFHLQLRHRSHKSSPNFHSSPERTSGLGSTFLFQPTYGTEQTCKSTAGKQLGGNIWRITRKPSCRWQTRATLAKSLHGLRKSSGVVSCIASFLIDSVPMVSYYVPYSNCVCKMRRFGDTRLLKLLWPWNPGQGSLKVIESDTIR